MDSQKREAAIKEAAVHYGNFLKALGFDWQNDEHMRNTPIRVAKAWVNDLACGLFYPEPNVQSFPNTKKYDGMIFSGKIDVVSMCSHHNLPFFGKAYCAYIADPEGKVIGLSKFNRLVEWLSRRPEVQENLTMSIHDKLSNFCEGNRGVAVMIEANHMCCQLRGVRQASVMKTSKMSGEFMNDNSLSRQEFYDFIRDIPRV